LYAPYLSTHDTGTLYWCFHPGCGLEVTTLEILNAHLEIHDAFSVYPSRFSWTNAGTNVHGTNVHGTTIQTPGLNMVYGEVAMNTPPAISQHSYASETMGYGSMPSSSGTVATIANVPPAPEINQEPGSRPRFPYSICGETFARRGDMHRHAKKHGPSKIYCPVLGCRYGGHPRKDKVNQHIKNRHPNVGKL